MNPVDLLFSHAGTINRRTYAMGLAGLVWGVPLLSAIFPPAMLLVFPMFYAVLCLTVKRLHDVGLSGKWAMLPLVAVVIQVAVLLISGVIAFGGGAANPGEQAREWAGAVAVGLTCIVFLSWAALIVMPGNVHSRTKFGRPAPPLIAPPVPDLKAVGARLRDAAPKARKLAASSGRTLVSAIAAFSRVNYLKLFFVASGRIGRGVYGAAFLILLFVFVLSFIPLASIPALNWVVALIFFHCMICLAAKRLHDFGASGWLAGMPFMVLYAFAIFLFMMALVDLGLFGQEIRNHPLTQAFKGSANDWAGMILLASLLAYGVIGLIPGERGPNEHGDDPSLPLADDSSQLAAA